MSRSFKRKPFMAITGAESAKQDKSLANRGVRRAHKEALHKMLQEQDYEDFLLPHILECHHNNVYDWGRDGHPMYQGLDHRDWQRFLEADSEDDYFGAWPPKYYVKMMRK
jgi:hypothetical protein